MGIIPDGVGVTLGAIVAGAVSLGAVVVRLGVFGFKYYLGESAAAE